ncbi:MAG TPA: hypothetical protein VNZ05_09755, partial [Solirubrobacteraceae bacterium]|nr:hypothetical protein [Solirubrobacteraceae bacterium]
MIAKFRAEFEAHIETARERRGLTEVHGGEGALAAQGALHVDARTLAPTGASDGGAGARKAGA